MEETREQQRLYFFFQGLVYSYVCLEILLFANWLELEIPPFINELEVTLRRITLFQNLFYSKAFSVLLVLIVTAGSKPRRSLYPISMLKSAGVLLFGLGLMGMSVLLYGEFFQVVVQTLRSECYAISSFAGIILTHVGLDNLQKSIRHRLRQDLWNRENESFPQCMRRISSKYSVHFRLKYYYQGRRRKGWVNITNPFRGTMVIGTPGSGKSYSIIVPYMKQVLAKGFSCVIYDFKYPDLTELAYASYQKHRNGALKNHQFHVVNLSDPSLSVRVNPLDPAYISTLPQAVETAEALIYALKKSDNVGGSDQFFTQSAINMLAAVIYYLVQHEGGTHSHFPGVLSFLQLDYEEQFVRLKEVPEVLPLINPFISAYKKGAMDQLEGQLGTLRINLARLATSEVYQVFSKNEVNLRINHLDSPSILILASSPETQEINSACYALLINRLIKLMNQKRRLPSALIIDEVPTLYIHRLENLLATARSNKVAILLGLQELPQFRQQYGRQAAETICAVIANVIAGQVQNKETLDWLERLFGKITQLKRGINLDRNRYGMSVFEQLDYAIPASRIAKLSTGEFAGRLAINNASEIPLFCGKVIPK